MVVAVVIAGFALGIHFLMPGEEGRVRKRLSALAETVGTPVKEPDMARLVRIARLRGYFAPDAAVYFQEEAREPLAGRDQIIGLAAPALAQLGPFKVELSDVHVELREAAFAEARMTTRLVSRDANADPATLDGRTVSVTLTRIDGVWMIASARIGERDDSIR